MSDETESTEPEFTSEQLKLISFVERAIKFYIRYLNDRPQPPIEKTE